MPEHRRNSGGGRPWVNPGPPPGRVYRHRKPYAAAWVIVLILVGLSALTCGVFGCIGLLSSPQAPERTVWSTPSPTERT
jgi:hypothetical protein